MKTPKKTITTGKRKMALAKAVIQEGTGKVLINNKSLNAFQLFQKLALQEPLRIAEEIIGEKIKQFDIFVTVKGGGSEGQIDAARLAIARAILAETKNAELKKEYLRYDRMLLIADTRRKEQRKPNDSKARAKRQKSYR